MSSIIHRAYVSVDGSVKEYLVAAENTTLAEEYLKTTLPEYAHKQVVVEVLSQVVIPARGIDYFKVDGQKHLRNVMPPRIKRNYTHRAKLPSFCVDRRCSNEHSGPKFSFHCLACYKSVAAIDPMAPSLRYEEWRKHNT